jgi:hypothetical protein
MLRWWSPTPKDTKKTLPARPRRITLHLEALEARNSPSAFPPDAPLVEGDAVLSDTTLVLAADPGLSLSPSGVPGPEGTATASGEVSGASPDGGTTVTLSGVDSGSVTTNADGAFTYAGPASGSGQDQPAVTGYAVSPVSPPANQAPTPPTIVNFQAVNNGNNSWTFSGQVQAPDAAGLVVTLAGIPTLDDNNVSVTAQADGAFSYTVTLQPGESGGVTAETVDRCGQASNEATAFVTG